MRKIALTLTLLATAYACALNADLAQAQPTRVFVAAQGSDGNPCTFALPCRTFQHAHDVVAAKGEIDVLDPAGYGALTITKAISIQGHDFSGVTVPSGGNGITINAGAGDDIDLRGLIIEGGGLGGVQNGVVFNTGASLTIESCLVRGLGNIGIVFAPSDVSSLFVSNTLVAHNASIAMLVGPTGAGAVRASLNRVELYKNGGDGLLVSGQNSTGTIDAFVTDSVAAGNTGTGFRSLSQTVAVTVLTVVRSATVNNAKGMSATGLSAAVRISQVAIAGNGTSWQEVQSGSLRSYADNVIDGNGDANPAPTTIPKK